MPGRFLCFLLHQLAVGIEHKEKTLKVSFLFPTERAVPPGLCHILLEFGTNFRSLEDLRVILSRADAVRSVHDNPVNKNRLVFSSLQKLFVFVHIS